MRPILRAMFVSALLAAVIAAEPQKILMIGNSLTYVYGIPQILERFAAATKRTLTVTPHIAGGKSLTWHWNTPAKPSDLTAPQDITQGGYDLVVLQEYSNLLLKQEGQDDFIHILPEYLKTISGASTQAMLYMAHPTRAEVDQGGVQPIIDLYSKQADEFHLVCSPVILAFVRSNDKLPKLALMDCQADRTYALGKTNTHQSPFGAYLAACTLFATIFRESPVGIDFHAAFDGKTEVPIAAADAAAAQAIAWQVWQEYEAKHPNGQPAKATKPKGR